MRKNLLIKTEQLATNILFSAAPIAKTISDNNAKMYFVRCQLTTCPYNFNYLKLWIWAVKSGTRSYCGIIYNSGIIPDNGTEISSAVFANFYEDDILNENEQSVLKSELCPGITLRLDQEGYQYLEEIKFPDNLSAAEALRKKHPELRGGAIMIKVGEPKEQVSYWVIANSSNGYEGISPFDGTEITISRSYPMEMVSLGEHAGKGFYLKNNARKFILTRKKATLW